MRNKLSQQASTTARDSFQSFWTQVHNLLQIFCPIFPSFAYRNCCAGTMSRKKEKKSETSPCEENFQKEPVDSSQSYFISPHLLLEQRICLQDRLSHEHCSIDYRYSNYVTSTESKSVILTTQFALKVFQSLYGNKHSIHYKASVLPLCCTSSVQSQIKLQLL